MSRIDFYTKVHKAIRGTLFDLSRRAAVIDYADPHALRALGRELSEVLARLSSHARHEARFIHPLLVDKTGQSPFDAEHERLEAEQAGLCGAFAAACDVPARQRPARGLAFYRSLNAFIGRYLEHLDREEATMPLLWERCTDDELRSVMTRFGASRPVDEALADMGWMLPALNGSERAELIGGMAAALARQPGPR
ncbi:MAG: hemerythrin domain-containing protein [Burkholderiales bacterium]